MTTELDLPIFSQPVTVPEELERRARELGWDDGLVRRALELRVPQHQVAFWQEQQQLTNDRVIQEIDRIERLRFGTLRAREAVADDDEALADMFANAPERIGEWEVTTERSPNPFAQFQLQERPSIQLLEDRGVILGATPRSTRNSIVGGVRMSAHIQTAFRVRKECRGLGYSNLLRMAEGPATSWYPMLNYYYVRVDNVHAFDWIKSMLPETGAGSFHEMQEVAGQSATVYHLTPRVAERTAVVRPACRDDLPRCIELINRTHDGFDLFRPYAVEFLQDRLDGAIAAFRLDSHTHPYGWEDFLVVEKDGAILACGGLWDRGRDVREVWRNTESDDARTVASTALMDFGFAEGREDAMVELIAAFAAKTAELGRDSLLAPVEHMAGLLERLAQYEPAPETRVVQYTFERGVPELEGLKIERPYTDLAYW